MSLMDYSFRGKCLKGCWCEWVGSVDLRPIAVSLSSRPSFDSLPSEWPNDGWTRLDALRHCSSILFNSLLTLLMIGRFRRMKWTESRLSMEPTTLFYLPPIPLPAVLIIAHLISPLIASAAAVHDERIYTIDREEYERFAEQFLLPEDFDLAESTPIRKPTPQDLDSILNHELFEGDILGMTAPPTASTTQKSLFGYAHDTPPADDGHQPKKENLDRIFSQPYYSSLNTQTYPNKLWHDGNVPYILEEGMSAPQRAAIASAFDEYKGKTCIRFVPRQNTDADYIYVKRNYGFGCSSYVGRAGGNQTVSLEVDKCFSKGIIAHELMHALGFFHEHSRTDRDEYVDILEDNKIIDPLGMPYDYGSVMHYHKLAFSRNGRSTIVPKSKATEIGQRYKLSEIDAKKVNKLYRCDGAGIAKETTNTETTTAQIPNTETTTTQIPNTETTTAQIPNTETTTAQIPNTETTTAQIPNTETTEANTTTDEDEETTAEGSTETAPGEEETAASTGEPAATAMTTDGGMEEETTTETGEEGTTAEPRGTTPLTVKNKVLPKMRRTKGEWTGDRAKWPNVAKKFITLSIWSTRSGRKHNKGNGTPKAQTLGGEKPGGLIRIRGGGRERERCVDLNAHCEMWERLSHCLHSAKYMRHYCRKSCGFCDETEEKQNRFEACTDKNHFCTYWAQNGECDKGSKFMKLFCKRSCRLC
uniref:Metalloendopeptidase n=1 Tax=Globodera rostochiensis TaxID=31243 RepID=A0A914HXY7_GLORO